MTERDLEKIGKIIESCHINFLIGSGASRNYLDTLWNIEQLLTYIENEPASEEKIMIETSIKYLYLKKFYLAFASSLSNLNPFVLILIAFSLFIFSLVVTTVLSSTTSNSFVSKLFNKNII